METDFIKSVKHIEQFDSNEAYHSDREYISASGLKKLKISPAHFKIEDKKESEALDFGSAYHTRILEPDKFKDEFYVWDETEILEVLISEGSKKPRGTNKYKEWVKKQEVIAAGRTIISTDVFNHIEAMRKTLYSHRHVKFLFKEGEAEKSFYCDIETNEGFTVKVKVRPDFLKRRHCLVVDLKTALDASTHGFQKASGDRDYHIAAALYSDMMEAITGQQHPFFFVAQEKVKPYAFNIFEASPQFISQGRYEYENLLRLYNYCQVNDYWPGYQVFCENRYGVHELSLPPWAIKEVNWFNHLNK